MDLPVGFHRAEAHYHTYPEYRETCDDLHEDARIIREKVEKILLNFSEDYCGEISDSGDITEILKEIQTTASQIEILQSELEEVEESLSQCYDPDEEGDRAYDAWVENQLFGEA